MTRTLVLACLPLTALAFTAALAQQPQPVQASGVWARATPPRAATAAIYMTLTSPVGDRLTGASTPVAAKAAVHEMRMEGNIMRMRAVEGGLDLPAGKPVTLKPGGYHVMLEGLKAPLKPGETVPMHLTFQKAPPLDVTAQVQPIGAAGPGNSGHSGMPGMSMGK